MSSGKRALKYTRCEVHKTNVMQSIINVVGKSINYSKFAKLQGIVKSADVRKFQALTEIAEIVYNASEWFKSSEGKEVLKVNGYALKLEEFTEQVFGYGKSYANRLKRMHVQRENYAAYLEAMEADASLSRSAEGFLSWVNADAETVKRRRDTEEWRRNQTWLRLRRANISNPHPPIDRTMVEGSGMVRYMG